MGSLSLPSQKPGPGRLVTTLSVPAFTGLKSDACVTAVDEAGVPLQSTGATFPIVVVVTLPAAAVVVLLDELLLLLPHAATPTAMRMADINTKHLRTGSSQGDRIPRHYEASGTTGNPSLSERVHDFVGVPAIAGLDREFENRGLEGDTGQIATVCDVDDVSAGARNEL